MSWLNHLSSNQFIALFYSGVGSLFILKKNFSALWHLLAVISLPLLLSPFLNNPLTNELQENLNFQTAPLLF